MVLRKRRRPLSPELVDYSLDVEDITNFKQDSSSSSASDLESTPNSVTPIISEPVISDCWINKYAQIEAQTGAVVSRKKLREVTNWLRAALDGSVPRLLLLSGPPGCGKSSALHVAAKELDCEVTSWNAPHVSSRGISDSLLEDFQTFLVGAKYGALTIAEELGSRSSTRDKKVLLIDDLPLGQRDIEEKKGSLRDLFSNAAQFSPHPIVLLLSFSEKVINRLSKLILGPELLASSSIATIKLLPVTEIMAKKRLNEILKEEKQHISTRMMSIIIDRSRGDFRAALNDLQLTCCQHEEGGSKRTKLHNRSSAGSDGVHQKQYQRRKPRPLEAYGRDLTLNSYHAVSKILNNKRAENGESKYDVEELLEESRMEPSSFLSFLHQNCLEFFGDIDGLADTFSCLSECDTLLRWRQDDSLRADLSNCAGSVATRAFLIFNNNPVRKGWRPIRASDTYQVSKEARIAKRTTHRQQVSYRPSSCTTYELLEMNSYLEVINHSNSNGNDDYVVLPTPRSNDATNLKTNNISMQTLQNPNSSTKIDNENTKMDEIEDWDD